MGACWTSRLCDDVLLVDSFRAEAEDLGTEGIGRFFGWVGIARDTFFLAGSGNRVLFFTGSSSCSSSSSVGRFGRGKSFSCFTHLSRQDWYVCLLFCKIHQHVRSSLGRMINPLLKFLE